LIFRGFVELPGRIELPTCALRKIKGAFHVISYSSSNRVKACNFNVYTPSDIIQYYTVLRDKWWNKW